MLLPLGLLALSSAAGSLQDSPTLIADLDTTPLGDVDSGNSFAIRGTALGLLWMDGVRETVDSMAWTLSASGAEPAHFVIPESEYGSGFFSDFEGVSDLGTGRALLTVRNDTSTLAPLYLYGTDGTGPATVNLGVRPVHDFTISGDDDPYPVVDSGVAYLRGTAEGGVVGVYRSDGTLAGTWRLAEVGPGVNERLWKVGDWLVGSIVSLSGAGVGNLLFAVPVAGGAPVTLVSSPFPNTSFSARVVGDVLVFGFKGEQGVGDLFGRELWSTDGTPGGKGLMVDLNPGPESSIPMLLSRDGQRAFFSAFTPATGRELWTTDGTPEGTVFAADLAPGAASGVPASTESAARLGSGLVLRASADAMAYEPWYSDGTGAGTYEIADLSSSPCGSLPTLFFGTPFHTRPRATHSKGWQAKAPPSRQGTA